MATRERYPASRLDALTDGVFGVAMTLLVLDIRLQEPLPQTPAALLAALAGQAASFGTYALAFFLLGLRWVMGLRPADEPETTVSRHEAFATLAYLFLVTCVPFTIGTVRHMPGLWPAVGLFALNMALLAASGLWLLGQGNHSHPLRQRRRRGLVLLLACAVLAMLAAPWLGGRALWIFLFTAVWPMRRRFSTN